MTDTMSPDLKALRASAEGNKELYKFAHPDPAMLESFETPAGPNGIMANMVIRIEQPEFTSLCPITGQPDFATIKIVYRPRKLCVESKSLKLYFLGFRMHGEFHEGCVQRILRDLVNLLDPLFMEVIGEFAPRGGIPFWPIAHYMAPDWDENQCLFRTSVI